MSVDIYETDDAVIIKAPLAGVESENIEIALHQDLLANHPIAFMLLPPFPPPSDGLYPRRSRTRSERPPSPTETLSTKR